MLKSQIKYVIYEIKNSSKANIIFLVVYLILYLYFMCISKPINEYTSGECYLSISIISMFILIRIILAGFNIPVNAYKAEERKGMANIRNGVVDVDYVKMISVRIIYKALISAILNLGTVTLFMLALNMVVDFRNYILLGVLILFGTIHAMTFGIIALTIIKLFKIKNEMIAIFEIVFLWLCLYLKEDLYYFPMTIFMTQVEGIFMNDIIYSKFNMAEIMSYSVVWLMMLGVFLVIVSVSNVLLTSSLWGRVNEKIF